jgi:hypothetical protein
MSSAIATAYILLRIIKKLQAFNFNEKFDTDIDSLKISDSFLQKIRKIIIKVIRTGGTPTIFTKEKDFINFYKALGHNYIHFVNYTMDDYDNYTYNLKCDTDIYINYLMYEIKATLKGEFILAKFININNSNRRPYTTINNTFHHKIDIYINNLTNLLKIIKLKIFS